MIDLDNDGLIEIHIKSIKSNEEFTFEVEYDWIDSETIGFQFTKLDRIIGNSHENLTISFT